MLVLALMLRVLTWDSKKSVRDETPAGGVLTGVAPPAGLQPLTPAPLEGKAVMPRFVKDGHPPVESSAPRDRVNLLAQGYREEKARTKAVQAADRQQATAKPAEPKKG